MKLELHNLGIQLYFDGMDWYSLPKVAYVWHYVLLIFKKSHQIICFDFVNDMETLQ